MRYKIKNITNKIICGNTLAELKKFPDECIDTVVTSPPYWGLRNYGEKTKTVWDGNPNCKHRWVNHQVSLIHENRQGLGRPGRLIAAATGKYKRIHGFNKTAARFCKKCGAWFGQYGLEPTLDMFIDHSLQITAELRRVLKPTGVIFWNHGDAYASGGTRRFDDNKYGGKSGIHCGRARTNDYLTKCMLLQNYRLAMRMIDDQDWMLRNVIIWYKPNHMPSSVKDRFANAYDSVFMIVKNKKYWFDLDAVRVPHCMSTLKRIKYPTSPYGDGDTGTGCRMTGSKKGKVGHKMVELNPAGKNPGDVWRIPTQSFPGAHFATYPEKLIEPMIKAACPRWICRRCGRARVRIKKTKYIVAGGKGLSGKNFIPEAQKSMKFFGPSAMKHGRAFAQHYTIGWTDCGCNAGWRKGIVLDPFMGSGTTALVAINHDRNFVGIDINPDYVKMANGRLKALFKRLYNPN